MLFQVRVRWKRFVRNLRHGCWLFYMTFFYNEFSSVLARELGLAPVYCIISLVNKYFQIVLPYLVVVLVASVVFIFHLCIVPVLLMFESTLYVCVHLTFGHWLLLNIAFNFYSGLTVAPGYPPNFVDEMVSICKNCISPKPPRTHHCSVCRRCILKMDHHCPWLNNCIGFYNHRYFFLFVAYLSVGCLFVTFHCWSIFRDRKDFNIYAKLCAVPLELSTNSESEEAQSTDTEEASYICPVLTSVMFYNFISFEFVLCIGAALALAALGGWHAYLVSFGQTSIELHVNKRERSRLKKLGLVYRNPYDFGVLRNWKMFLGIDHSGNSFWRHVLFPSRHTPNGDALHFRTCFLDAIEVERSFSTDSHCS